MRPFRNPLRAAALAALLAPAAPAQWDVLALDPANPVLAGGFQLLHDDGLALNAFSAFAQQWRPIAPPGTAVLGHGDFVALLEEPAGLLVGYSARLDRSAPAPVAGGVLLTRVEDDVALVVETVGAGLVAHGYSGQTNTWASVALAAANLPSANVASSRFVLGIRDTGNLLGFSARRAAWVAQPVAGAALPVADGNVVACDIAQGGQRVAAFSGALGAWSVSPVRAAGTSHALDHNVAHMTTDGPQQGLVRDVAYSAYTSVWEPNPQARNAAFAPALTLRDNLVCVASASPGFGTCAYGARPGLWDQAPPAFALLGAGEDSLVLHDGAFAALGFSGLATGVFAPQATATMAPLYLGPDDHLSAVLDGPGLRLFSPATGAWTPPAPVPAGALVLTDDAVAAIVDPAGAAAPVGWTTRSGTWVAGPALVPTSVETGGSVVALQDAAGVAAVLSERCHEWLTLSVPGGAATSRPGRNLVLLDSAAGVSALSVQRGKLDPAPTVAASLPPSAPPIVEENVAFFVDATGLVGHAFASPGEFHVRNQWPRDTEYQTFGPAPLLAADLFVSLRTPGALQNGWLFDGAHFCPGTAVLPLPSPPLFLPAPTLLPALGPSGAGGKHAFARPVGAPVAVEVWSQGAHLTAGAWLLTANADPAWLF